MGIIDLKQNDLEFEETYFQCSYDEESCSSPDSIYKFEFPTVGIYGDMILSQLKI